MDRYRHTAGEGKGLIQGEQDLIPAGEGQVADSHNQKRRNQPQIEPGDPQDVAKEELVDASPIAAHEAESHHGQGQGRGIDDVEQGIGRQLAALHQMVHP